jgi:hypothetical protein
MHVKYLRLKVKLPERTDERDTGLSNGNLKPELPCLARQTWSIYHDGEPQIYKTRISFFVTLMLTPLSIAHY